jgi:hypothetical protein
MEVANPFAAPLLHSSFALTVHHQRVRAYVGAGAGPGAVGLLPAALPNALPEDGPRIASAAAAIDGVSQSAQTVLLGSPAARGGAYGRALRDYIHSLDEPSAQSLLHSVLAEYDALQFERVEEEMTLMLTRLRAVEAREAMAREAGPRRSSAPARARRSSSSSNRCGAMPGSGRSLRNGSIPLLQRRGGGGGGPQGGHPAGAG